MEAEQQQGNQKVVVALIFGLVIGAFLMWMFNGQPKSEVIDTADQADTEETTETESSSDSTDTENGSATVSVAKPTVTAGAGSVAVLNQKAGSKVALGTIKYPSEAGWLAVHATENGTMRTGALGASRYNTKDGLIPQSIDLLYSTTAGAEYMVVFHEDNMDGKYTSADKVMMGADGKALASSFKAE